MSFIRKRHLVLAIFSVVYFALSAKCQQNGCVNKITCHECIQTSECAWCAEPSFDESLKPRCFSKLDRNFCDAQYVHNPQSIQEIITEEPLSRRGKAFGQVSSSGGGGGSYRYDNPRISSNSGTYNSYGSTNGSQRRMRRRIVQISPQKINLKLRISTFIFIYYNSQFSIYTDFSLFGSIRFLSLNVATFKAD